MNEELTQLMQVVMGRRSVRRFTSRSIERPVLEGVLEAARWAPSAGNRQAFRVIAVSRATLISQLADAVAETCSELVSRARASRQDELSAYAENFVHFREASVVLVPIFRQGPDLLAGLMGTPERAANPRAAVDALSSVSAAVMNILLAAHASGLGACWMTGPLIAAQQLDHLLEVPKGWAIAALIPLGYAAEQPDAPRRRPLDTLVRHID